MSAGVMRIGAHHVGCDGGHHLRIVGAAAHRIDLIDVRVVDQHVEIGIGDVPVRNAYTCDYFNPLPPAGRAPRAGWIRWRRKAARPS
jgi:hypothetical protein